MLERSELIRKLRAPDSCIQGSYAVRSENTSLRLASCGDFWLERHDAEGFIWGPARCRSRWCPSCQNLWRGPVIEAFQRAVPPELKVTLITLTGGSTVYPEKLSSRLTDMGRGLRRWKRKAEKEGLRGGVYCWEVAEELESDHQTRTGRLHAHLHISSVYSPEAWWALEDSRAVDSSAVHGDTTAALGWLALSWADALQREAPALYAELPTWKRLLPSIEAFRAQRFPEMHCPRGAVCDIGGRWPNPNEAGKLLQRLGWQGPSEALEQTVKYAVKEGGRELSPEAWIAIFKAFQGRRRVQGFGCLYGVKPSEPEEQSATEGQRSELTGAVAWIAEGRKPDLEQLNKAFRAFFWGASVSGMEASENASLVWLKCRLEEE